MTTRARALASELPTGREPGARGPFAAPTGRVPVATSLDPARGRRAVRLATRGLRELEFGKATIDLAAVEQLIDPSQLRTLGRALVWLRDVALREPLPLAAALDAFEATVRREGLDALCPAPFGDLAEVRRHELAAALNRLRTLRVQA